MRPRTLVFITLLALCHPLADGQAVTNAIPPSQHVVEARFGAGGETLDSSQANLPDDPGQEMLPVARPEPQPPTGTPVEWQAQRQQWAGDVVTLEGDVVFHYRGYVLRADKVTYNRATTETEADGHLELTGGPSDLVVHASHGEMRLATHTARLYNVSGSQGVRTMGHRIVYSTPNPLLFTARVLIETGEGNYRLVDGTFTNCRLPHPDWQIIAHSIALDQKEASTKNSVFKLLGVPVFYLPYLKHSVTATGRQSGLLIPVVGTDSIRGYIFGEQVYWALNRSMDMVLGTEYFSKRGWAPNGDFRYKGPGLDNVMAHWSALFDRGVTQPGTTKRINQGGIDVSVQGSKDISPYTRIAGTAEYLSSYVYRLVFNENYSQATSSEVSSNVAFVHARNGFVPSVSFQRYQNFASAANGDEIRLLHLPSVRYDVLDRRIGAGPLDWGLASSLNYLSRSEPNFHARNVGRLDIYPHLLLPIFSDGWSVTAEGGFRSTSYTISQNPDLTGANNFVPTVSHDPVHRIDAEAHLDIRPPVLERDYHLGFAHRELRHTIEPEFGYNLVDGVGATARNVLLFDTTDIVTDTNELAYSLTQRFFLRRTEPQPCTTQQAAKVGSGPTARSCPPPQREWASWQVAQKYFFDPRFGGALIPHRRNVFATTLDLTGTDFLTEPRNLSPIVSRMRLQAVDNLRIEWDMDYDLRRGKIDADNEYAGYSFGRTTVGVTHSLLNAFDELPQNARGSRTLKSQIVAPFLEYGKQNAAGFNLAVNGGYDAAEHIIQYAGVQAVYNWDCCGLTMGYRRFQLGSVGTASRDETQWLYSFTLANFGSVGDVRRSTSIFHDPTLPPAY
ncbi:MAG: LPS-assembly protein LptD [Acidobacteriota bacterium]